MRRAQNSLEENKENARVMLQQENIENNYSTSKVSKQTPLKRRHMNEQ